MHSCGPGEIYDAVLSDLLNTRHPTADQASSHRHVNMGFHGAGSCTVAPATRSVILPRLKEAEVDLLVLEFTMNDDVYKKEKISRERGKWSSSAPLAAVVTRSPSTV